MGVGWTALSPSAPTFPTRAAIARACKKSKTNVQLIAWWVDFVTWKKAKQVGSLLLGLYDKAGLLDHVGFMFFD